MASQPHASAIDQRESPRDAHHLSGVNRDSAVPLHHQLKEALLGRMRRERLKVGDQVWTEKQLETDYGVSRTTVRQALSTLSHLGVLSTVRGKGTFVARPPIPEALPRLAGLTEEMSAVGRSVTSNVLTVEYVTPSPAVRDGLGLYGATDRVLLVSRTRLVDGEPVFFVNDYLADVCGLTAHDDFSGSLFQLLMQRSRLRVARAEMTIGAVEANELTAISLRVKRGTALLKNFRVFYSPEGQRLIYEEEWCRSDRYLHAVTLEADNANGVALTHMIPTNTKQA